MLLRRGRRRNRKPLTEAQRKRLIRRDEAYERQEKIEYQQKKDFLKAYTKICRRYGCYVSGLGGGDSISKQRKGEKIYTITSHLEGLRSFLTKWK